MAASRPLIEWDRHINIYMEGFSLNISFTKLFKCAIGGLTKTRLIYRKSTVDIIGHQNPVPSSLTIHSLRKWSDRFSFLRGFEPTLGFGRDVQEPRRRFQPKYFDSPSNMSPVNGMIPSWRQRF